MATQPIIISDDGSPPPLLSILHLAVTHPGEPMVELKQQANGHHPIKGSAGITGVTITQHGTAIGDPISGVNSVVVWGDKGTKITVEKDSSNVVAVSANKTLNEDCSSGFCRYEGIDTTITKVVIDGDETKFTPNGKLVRVEVKV